jgi:hypothetical protein
LGDKIGKAFFSFFDNFVEASETRFNYFNGFKEKWLPIFYNGVTISSKFQSRPEGRLLFSGRPITPWPWKFPESPLKIPPTNRKILAKIPLTGNSPLRIFDLPQSECLFF